MTHKGTIAQGVDLAELVVTKTNQGVAKTQARAKSTKAASVSFADSTKDEV